MTSFIVFIVIFSKPLSLIEDFVFFIKYFIRFRWFCHFDDDNYVNIPQLQQLLSEYDPSADWYLGRPSIASPLEIKLSEVCFVMKHH